MEGGHLTHDSRCWQRQDKVIRSGAGVTGACKLPYVGVGDWIKSSWKSSMCSLMLSHPSSLPSSLETVHYIRYRKHRAKKHRHSAKQKCINTCIIQREQIKCIAEPQNSTCSCKIWWVYKMDGTIPQAHEASKLQDSLDYDATLLHSRYERDL